jgi:hypothetical protein
LKINLPWKWDPLIRSQEMTAGAYAGRSSEEEVGFVEPLVVGWGAQRRYFGEFRLGACPLVRRI